MPEASLDSPLPSASRGEASARGSAGAQRAASLLGLGVLGGLNLWWAWLYARRDSRPPSWDPSVHLGMAKDYQRAIFARHWLKMLLAQCRPGHPPYPPFFHYLLIPLLSFPRPHILAALLNGGFLVVLLAATWWLCEQLAGPWQALGAAAVVGLCPGILGYSRLAYVDICLAAWVALALALLVYSDGFRRRGPCLAFGAAFGLAMLTKWTACIYLAPAAGLLALDPAARRRNIKAAAGLAAALMAPWYLVNSWQLAGRLFHAAAIETAAEPLWSVRNWTFYPKVAMDYFSAPGCALLALGLALALRAGPRRRLRAARLLLAAGAVSYIVCTLVTNKQDRYLLPAFAPGVALAASGWPPALVPLAGALAWRHLRLPAPDPGDWKHEAVLAAVESARGGRPYVTLSVVPNVPELNANNITWELEKSGGAEKTLVGGLKRGELVEYADFVLTKTGFCAEKVRPSTAQLNQAVADPKSAFSRYFSAVGRWPLPDGSEAVLYRRGDGDRDFPKRRSWPVLELLKLRMENAHITPAGPHACRIRAARLSAGKVPGDFQDVELLLTDAHFAETEAGVQTLALGKVEFLKGRADLASLGAELTQRAGPLQVRLYGEGPSIRVWAGLRRAGVSVLVTPEASTDRLSLRLSSPRLFGLALPLGQLFRFDFPTHPVAGRPFAIAFKGLSVSPSAIQIQ